MNLVPNRSFSTLYILLDVIFLLVLVVHMIRTKRHIPLLVGVVGGLLYFLVDYGGFYALLGTRQVTGAPTFIFLLWLSMSYGFTNMAWMWLWFAEKKNRFEWSALIITAWFSISIISAGLGKSFPHITMSRATSSYHWIIATFLIVGYTILFLKNLRTKNIEDKIDIKSILLIGLLVQFSWESVLFITGIRQAGIHTLVINSLLETNMGAPYMYFIYAAVKKKYPKLEL